MNFRRQPDDDEEFSDAPLTPDETRRMRRMLRDEEFARRFWRTVRIWTGYITGAIIAIWTASTMLQQWLKGLVK